MPWLYRYLKFLWQLIGKYTYHIVPGTWKKLTSVLSFLVHSYILYWFPHLFINPFIHSPYGAYPLNNSPTHPLTHWLSQPTQLSKLPIYWLCHLLTHFLTHPLNEWLTHLHVYPPIRTHTPTHSHHLLCFLLILIKSTLYCKFINVRGD